MGLVDFVQVDVNRQGAVEFSAPFKTQQDGNVSSLRYI